MVLRYEEEIRNGEAGRKGSRAQELESINFST
jgi:hypothetical protein